MWFLETVHLVSNVDECKQHYRLEWCAVIPVLRVICLRLAILAWSCDAKRSACPLQYVPELLCCSFFLLAVWVLKIICSDGPRAVLQRCLQRVRQPTLLSIETCCLLCLRHDAP